MKKRIKKNSDGVWVGYLGTRKAIVFGDWANSELKAKHWVSVPYVRDTFSRLERGNVLGAIDSHGACHSMFTGDQILYHDDHYPMMTHARWRWTNNGSIAWFGSRGTEEDCDTIRHHMTKKYGLKWWENGHHDTDHLKRQIKKEQRANK